MSDSQYENNLGYKLDIVDEAWAADILSDDEIELPPEADPIPDENDIEPADTSDFKKKEEEKWADLALDTFEYDGVQDS